MKNKVKPRPTYPTSHLEESFFEKSSGLDLPFHREQKPSPTQQSRFLTELLEYPGTKTHPQNTEPKTPLSIHWEVPCRLSVLPAWSVPTSFCFSPQCGSPGPRHIPALLCWAPPTSLHGNRWLFSMFQKLYNLSCTNYSVIYLWRQSRFPTHFAIPLKIMFVCLGLLIDNAISIEVQLCKLLIKHWNRGKSWCKWTLERGKKHFSTMLKCCRKDENYCGKYSMI